MRRALAGSRNVPAVKLAEKVGINSVVDMTRRFGITTPLPPYLPLVLGAADMKLLEHVSAFTVFPNDGIRIDPHMIRRVTSYDGALLEEAHPEVHDVISPEVARTMTAMLEEVIQFGTGVQAKALGRPAAGKTGTTQDYTDAWFMGFTPQLTCGVWVGFDDKQISLGKKETGARAALPIWLEFMKTALEGQPPLDFANVVTARAAGAGSQGQRRHARYRTRKQTNPPPPKRSLRSLRRQPRRQPHPPPRREFLPVLAEAPAYCFARSAVKRRVLFNLAKREGSVFITYWVLRNGSHPRFGRGASRPALSTSSKVFSSVISPIGVRRVPFWE